MSGQVAVFGAAGKTGQAVTAALRARDVPVRALVRRPRAVATAPGLEPMVLDMSRPEGLRAALTGCRSAYLLAPNVHPDEPGLLSPILAACADLGVRVVYHSVLHPFAPTMPHHLDKARVESLLHDSDLDWTVLQPASYLDNAAGVTDQVRTGRWPVPYSADTAFTPVALDDVGQVAARVLVEDGHRDATYELAGPQRLTTREMAAVAAELLGRSIDVVDTHDEWAAGPGAALEPGPRARLQAMFDQYDRAGFCGGSAVLTQLLGRTPTTWSDWVRRTWLPT